MAKTSTRQAIANAFAPYSKEYQRRAAQADKAKQQSEERAKKNTNVRIVDFESPNRTQKFMTALKKKNKK